MRSYRVSKTQLTSIQTILSLYNGTHNFHNYIPDAPESDPRNFMRIHRIHLAPPEVHHNLEWIRVRLTADRFAPFQIRRMMGMLIQVVRTNTPTSIISHSFSIPRITIPTAPPCLILGILHLI